MSDREEEIRAAFFAGFRASGEGYNGEYPFSDDMEDIEDDERLKAEADKHVAQALTASGYGGFEVVPLVWTHKRSGKSGAVYCARTPFGSYLIHHRKSGAVFVSQSHAGGWADKRFDTLEAALAACEADHRERVSKLVRGVDVSDLVGAARAVDAELNDGGVTEWTHTRLAAAFALQEDLSSDYPWDADIAELWRVMVANAPLPPAPEVK